ncbi:hypothetical protein ACFVYT_40550, partial [Streptomyces sp. NPDC058290]
MTSAGFDDHPERAMLDRLEEYYDAVPRHGARVEDYGPITLFVREGLSAYGLFSPVAYGRTSPALTAGSGSTAEDLG